MNRTDRLLAIVLELQGRDRVTAADLAHTFEATKRTIYRDVLALNEAGVPIISAPGQGYTLMPGYFLPPLHFSVEEAVMLLLGSDVVAQAFEAGPAKSAARKLNAVLGEAVRDEVQFLYENLRLVQRAPEDLYGKVRTLRQTIAERRTVEFTYHKPHTEEEARQVDPHGLFQLNLVWLLVAFDHARADLRTFHLNRIEDLKVLPRQFRRQPHFKLERDETREGRELIVQALFDPEVAREVKNNLSYYVTQTQDTPDGLLVTLQMRTAEEVLPWLLSWGSRVRVLEPTALQTQLIRAAHDILERYA